MIRKYPEDIAKSKIRAWCNKAERSHSDVRKKLVDWGIPYPEREQLIGLLITENLLDEERFAKAFAHDKFSINRWGIRKIEQALKFKGVSGANIRIALGEIDPEEYEAEILKLIKKKELQYKGLQLYQKKFKLSSYLISRGYESELVRKVLETYYC